jgi:hypothetical protein
MAERGGLKSGHNLSYNVPYIRFEHKKRFIILMQIWRATFAPFNSVLILTAKR